MDVFAGDIRDPHGVRTAMQGCDVVLHLAALRSCLASLPCMLPRPSRASSMPTPHPAFPTTLLPTPADWVLGFTAAHILY